MGPEQIMKSKHLVEQVVTEVHPVKEQMLVLMELVEKVQVVKVSKVVEMVLQ